MVRLLAGLITVMGLSQTQGVAVLDKKNSHEHSALRATRKNARDGGFVKAMEFKHRLRICNAFPYKAALDVFDGGEKLTAKPMEYKACQDFSQPLTAGDKLEFKVGDASAGTFSVSDLPNNDAVLLLVIHRHDTLSTAVSFESHVFANLANAQVAVIDTYKGKAEATPATPKIADFTGGKLSARNEELRYNSVVAVNPGKYEVMLDSPDGVQLSKNELVAVNGESYVVIRMGVEAKDGESYPEELVVFPQSDPALLHSAASPRAFVGFMLMSVIAVTAL